MLQLNHSSSQLLLRILGVWALHAQAERSWAGHTYGKDSLEALDQRKVYKHAYAEAPPVESLRTNQPLVWTGSYTKECSTSCGKGVQTLLPLTVKCCKSGTLQEVPRRHCEERGEQLKQPPATKACVDLKGCEWSVGAPPSDRCGWPILECKTRGGSPDGSILEYCSQASEMGLIERMEKFRSRQQPVSDGCPGEDLSAMKSLCTITLNQPAGGKAAFMVNADHLSLAKQKATTAIQGCGDAGIVAFATQELKMTFPNMFPAFSDFVGSIAGYTEVGRCGGTISPGVVVLVKEHLRHLFAPVVGDCFNDDNTYEGVNAYTNTKGTAFLEMFTVRGTFVAASTHGQRGGVKSQPRVEQVKAAVKYIMSKKPTIVAWGGDFNVRTAVHKKPNDASTDQTAHDLLSAGTTHPPQATPTLKDMHEGLEFNPARALEILASIPEVLGGEKTLNEVVHEESGAYLAEVPGLKNQCPSYPKTCEGKAKDTEMLLLHDGTEKKKSRWKTPPPDAKPIQYWRPSLACRAPGSSDTEYFESPHDGKTRWPDHAPSWCERLIVTAATAQRCDSPRKVISEEDHDAVYVKCDVF